MTDKKMTKQEAILELRREAQELDEKRGSLSEYARNTYKARIRRELADKLEQELREETQNKE